MEIWEFIDSAARRINERERKINSMLQNLAFLREIQLNEFGSPELSEERFVFKIPEEKINGKVAGVDSGFCMRSFSGIDIMLVRTAGVVFEFKNSSLSRVDYLPKNIELPKPILREGLEKDEAFSSESVMRLMEELEIGIKLIENYRPDFLLLDGSIVPQYADKPRKDSKVIDEYHQLIEKFQELYSKAIKNRCKVVGCVEDSRGSRLRQIIEEQILAKKGINIKELNQILDSRLVAGILRKGERSFAFKYSPNIAKHPILVDMEEKFAENIYVFYLKASEFDMPLRLEFIAANNNITKEADKIASLCYALSSLHRGYSYPSVLIEADLRARLQSNEIEIVFSRIANRISPALKMRRSSRPF
ncbi:MAG: DNA double-strand break repair nuclease NurA [Candidatus Diapherotrites archaeon]|nr:DNA double-strand break repair nuclease NurA [Candidatus Diapherotrites archaeon]